MEGAFYVWTADEIHHLLDEAARLTSEFLDCLTRPVLEQHGTLDKYTGDGLVAFWAK